MDDEDKRALGMAAGVGLALLTAANPPLGLGIIATIGVAKGAKALSRPVGRVFSAIGRARADAYQRKTDRINAEARLAAVPKVQPPEPELTRGEKMQKVTDRLGEDLALIERSPLPDDAKKCAMREAQRRAEESVKHILG